MSSFTKRQKVTPQVAAKWLEKNTINRSLSDATVSRYAADMRNGAWLFNHQGIAFDAEGRLIDGQHRLSAIVKSGATVEMLVTTGLPVEQVNGVSINTMDTVDRLRLRRVGEQLQLRHGYRSGNVVAASAKVCGEICVGGCIPSISTAQTLKILDVYGKAIVQTLEETQVTADKKAPILGVIAFARVGSPEAVANFASQYFSGENLSKNHPALALRRWIGNHPAQTQGGGAYRWGFIKVIASAIYNASLDKSMSKIYQSDEAIDWLRAQQKSNARKIADVVLGDRAKA